MIYENIDTDFLFIWYAGLYLDVSYISFLHTQNLKEISIAHILRNDIHMDMVCFFLSV